jgi:5-(carboxyamino)imidazole ribonucleotide synthase
MKVGVLGSGQLALMLAQASMDTNIEVVPIGHKILDKLDLYCVPIYGDMNDPILLEKFLAQVDVVTYETENVSIDLLKIISKTTQVWPSLNVLEVFQDRLLEKQYFERLSIPVATYHDISQPDDIIKAAEHVGFPGILKTRRDGYDGKGQAIVNTSEELAAAWDKFEHIPCILEGFVSFSGEVSVISVRGTDGKSIFYPITENIHCDGILRLSTKIGESDLQTVAESYAQKIMEDRDYVGCMAIEFFVVDGALVANEVAPRVHNSGHWTIGGTDASQFANHLNAITGKPLVSPTALSAVAMINFISELPNPLELNIGTQSLFHDYGKENRPLRKVGHLTLLGDGMSTNEFYQLIVKALTVSGETALASKIQNEYVQ